MRLMWYYFKLDCKDAVLEYWKIIVWVYRRIA